MQTISKAEETIFLDNLNKEYFLTNENIEVFEDPLNELSIDQIASPDFEKKFKKLRTTFPENKYLGSAYWIKFKTKSKILQTKWVLECYNQNANFVELYTVLKNGKYKNEKTGSNLNFNERPLNHINFVFFLDGLSEEKTFYLKFVSINPIRVRLLIHSYRSFTAYALNEYYLLGMFYGMIIIISLYNLFLYPRLKDNAYLFYSIYALFVGLFLMSQDGTGFQYLWPEFPEWNNSARFFFATVMIVFMLLYTKSFLETKIKHPLLDKIISIFIIGRIILYIIAFLFIPVISELLWFDLFPFILAYIASIIAYRNNNKSALYFVIGFTVLFFGFLINTLAIFKFLPSNIYTVYAVNVGAIIEMILLSQALGDRVKEIREKELIHENLNRELEAKVKERTEALTIQNQVIEEKVKTLDIFIYKASHDIKGPLKSLIGLANLGLKDSKENAHTYFEHALKSAKKLDAIVKDLLQISQVNSSRLNISEIDFNSSIHEIMESLKREPGFSDVKLETRLSTEGKFYSDKSILNSIFQNLIENAIRYRNQRIKNSYLKIEINAKEQFAEIKFIDNGTGILPEFQDKIFDMFFRIGNEAQENTGLGLYIVKLSVEKLGGHISLISKHGEGTTFTVTIKNLDPY